MQGSVSLLDQLAPGGTLEWTVSGSGLGGIADLRLLDTLGDGQRMDTVFHPQVVVRRGSTTLFSGDLMGWSGERSASTATTAINFDLAPTRRAAGLAAGLTDDTTVTVTFHSVISSLYAALQAPPLGRVLGQGDLLRNTAVFSGTVAGTLSSSDPAATSLSLPSSTLAASVYAVNGVLASGTAHAAYGDIVTYRIQLGLPLTTAHQVELTASLAGLVGPFVFDAAATTGSPASGHAQFGPSGTYTATQPAATLTTNAAGNAAILFDFGDIQPSSGHPGTIDLLVSAPLEPGASLAATVTETEENSFGTPATVSATTAAVALNEPSLHIQTATVYALIYAETAKEVETRRKAFLRKWRLKCPAVATSLEEAGDPLHVHALSAKPVEVDPHFECHRAAARGVQAADQDPNRPAGRRNRSHAVLGTHGVRPDHHAEGRRLENPRRTAI